MKLADNRTISYRGRKLSGALLLTGALLVMLFLCTACASAAPEENGYRLYYLNKAATTIVPVTFRGEDTGDAEEMIGLFEEELSSPAEGNVQLLPPIAGFTVQSWQLVEGRLTIDMSQEYLELDPILEILTRAAIVNTMCQLEEVGSVLITAAGQALPDENGAPGVGMTADQFISSSGNEISNYERIRLHLYFANETGDRLVDTYRNVVYNSNVALERLVVEQVLKGPNSNAVYPALNPDTKVLNVTTRDGVCYVNLDSSFLIQPYKVTPQVAVYSLVNSLIELGTVSRVQISVEGNTSVNFMEIANLQTVFERNLTVVEGEAED